MHGMQPRGFVRPITWKEGEGRTVINHGGFGSRNRRREKGGGGCVEARKVGTKEIYQPPLSRFFSLSPSITGEMVSSPLWPGRRGPGGEDQEGGWMSILDGPPPSLSKRRIGWRMWLGHAANIHRARVTGYLDPLPSPPPMSFQHGQC